MRTLLRTPTEGEGLRHQSSVIIIIIIIMSTRRPWREWSAIMCFDRPIFRRTNCTQFRPAV